MLLGTIEESGRIRFDEPTPAAIGERVRLIVFLGEDDLNEHEWLRAATQGGAFDVLNAPDEDLYTFRDGKPFDDA